MLASDSQYTGFKNRIINGAMVIAQRATSVTGGSSYCCTDRFDFGLNVVNWNVAQSSDTPTGTGFRNSSSVTITSASSGATSYAYIYHAVEGYNWADLAYGTASAQTSTLSFWVKSSVTGTYGIALRNTLTARFYTTTYVINSANTWEQKTITITGDTSGTWNTTNGTGLGIFWDLGVGSTYSSTSNNAWSTVASNYFGVTGVTKLGATNGATFYITGVQLEKGSTATSFDYRPYQNELVLCQRYYETYSNGTGTGSIFEGLGGYFANSTIFRTAVPFKVTKRASPSVSFPTTYVTVNSLAGNLTPSGAGSNFSSPDGATINCDVSGATGGQGGTVGISSSAPITISAEL
jgi:hypothetical protein